MLPSGPWLALLPLFFTAALPTTRVEDFSTTEGRHPHLLQATWDTVGSRIELPPFAPAVVGSLDTPSVASDVALSGNVLYVADYISGTRLVDVSDPALPVELSVFKHADRATRVVPAGGHLFVALGAGGIEVLDVSDPGNPVSLATQPTSGFVHDLCLWGDLLVAASGAALEVIDVSDPGAPSLVSALPTPGSATGVVMHGNLAVVADYDGGILLVSLRDPASPQTLGSNTLSGFATEIAVDGSFAYVASRAEGLVIVDISDPSLPSRVAEYGTTSEVRNVVLSGNLAFLSNEQQGLVVLDVSNPSSPEPVTAWDSPDRVRSALPDGNRVFLADALNGVVILQWAVPANPVADLTWIYRIPGAINTRALATAGKWLFAGGNDYLLRADMSDPISPLLWSASLNSGHGGIIQMMYRGNHLFAACQGAGFAVIEVRQPGNRTAAWFDPPGGTGSVWDVAAWDDYLAVADADAGLHVYEIGDPFAPSFVTTYVPGTGIPTTVEIRDGIAYLGVEYPAPPYGTRRLHVVDLRNPGAPALLGELDGLAPITHLEVSGDLGVATGNSLQILDLSVPSSPAILFSGLPGAWGETALDGDLVHAVARAHAGNPPALVTFDILDPTSPQEIARATITGTPTDVRVSGDLVYVGTVDNSAHVFRLTRPVRALRTGTGTVASGNGIAVTASHVFLNSIDVALRAMDVSDPSTPLEAGTAFALSGSSHGLALYGPYAFVQGNYQLAVADVSDPSSPVEVSIIDSVGASLSVQPHGQELLLGSFTGSLLDVYDISDPTTPVLSHREPGAALQLEVRGDLAYAMSVEDSPKFLVLDISDPGAPVRLGSVPAPAGLFALHGDLAFLVDNDSLSVIDVSDPANPTLAAWTSIPSGSDYIPAVWGNRLLVNGGARELWFDIGDPLQPRLLLDRSHEPGRNIRSLSLAGEYVFTGEFIPGLVVERLLHRWRPVHTGSAPTITEGSRVVRVLLDAFGAGTTDWEASNDGGLSWDPVVANGGWSRLRGAGEEFVWRAFLTGNEVGPPEVTEAVWSLRYDHAVIDSVGDVPADEGGFVRVHFTRSGYDFAGEPRFPIDHYGIWRRVDPTSPAPPPLESRSTVSPPPGAWEFLGNVPASGQSQYVFTAASLGDSTPGGVPWSVFHVTAHPSTSTLIFSSPADSGYSRDNVAPGAPNGLAVNYESSYTALTWTAPGAPDVAFYRVYRDTVPGFDPGPATLVGETSLLQFQDGVLHPWRYLYRVSAVDEAGNEGPAVSPFTVIGTPSPSLPTRLALLPARPNPFRGTLRLGYEVPEGTIGLTLRVHDVRGRLVREWSDPVATPGRHETAWDGTDDHGVAQPAGVYFVRLTARGFEQTRRLVRLR